jgi:hypothetical protein
MLKHPPIRPLCAECNRYPARPNGVSKRGYQLWHKYCGSCAKRKYTAVKTESRKLDHCEDCGFVGHPCQLDLTEILGVTRTICANCNRLRIKHRADLERQRREVTVDATVLDLDYRL